MRDVANVFKALSDETHLRILNLLMELECSVCKVMQVLDLSQTRAIRASTVAAGDRLRLELPDVWTQMQSVEPVRRIKSE